EGAFSYAKSLNTIVGEENLTYISNYAFAYTAINNVDLSGVINLGSHVFIKENMSAFSVKLSSNLVEIGDNPFANCDVKGQFSTTEKTVFNGVEYEEVSYNYDISANVKVMDGSIYRVVPNGYELITFASTDVKNVRVHDNTVRIGAMAFMGTDVKNVFLPYTVASIGHKAFYKCDKLSLVEVTSYYAPVLEEVFDVIYANSGLNSPMQDEDAESYGWEGLGIVKYYMWNVWDSTNGTPVYSNFFYGANFVDYIGKISNGLVLVAPVNGENYESFVWAQYFDVIISGAAAADDITLEAIKAISAIPDTVQLTDKAIIEAARAAYDKVASYEQRALVANYQKLTDAELRIKTLENLAGGGSEETPDDDTTEEVKSNVPSLALSIAFGSAGIIGIVAIVIYLFMKGQITFPEKKKKVKKLVPGPNQKVVKKMVKKVVRRVVVYKPYTQENVETAQNNQQITQSETISEKEEDNE
ncbi:MAG: leucine-rich repeat domain-containing protein, partial [Clostridia bacterium]|nr:leucine-rich repeat domain-containing protein [Clostridia bacterium]